MVSKKRVTTKEMSTAHPNLSAQRPGRLGRKEKPKVQAYVASESGDSMKISCHTCRMSQRQVAPHQFLCPFHDTLHISGRENIGKIRLCLPDFSVSVSEAEERYQERVRVGMELMRTWDWCHIKQPR